MTSILLTFASEYNHGKLPAKKDKTGEEIVKFEALEEPPSTGTSKGRAAALSK